MAHPKRRQSKARSRKRRTHVGAAPVTFSTCGNCGSSVLRHRVCSECGYYRGKVAIEKDLAI